MYYLQQNKDYKLRLELKCQELNYLKLKALARNKIVPSYIRERALDTLSAEHASRTRTKIRNMCVLTGRSRGLVGRGRNKSAGLSRIVFKNQADAGLIAGVRRAS
jgi:ribosomal protein S14